MSLLSKVLGDPHKREIDRHLRVVEEINGLEEEMRALSDEELRHRTEELRERIGYEGPDISFGQTYAEDLDVLGESADRAAAEFASGDVSAESEAEIDRQFARREKKEREEEQAEQLDEILPEAFAVVREASRRVLGMRHFDVQLVGGIVLHDGKIAEMKTGEGKTLVATLPLYLNALVGKGAHLVTVNDYLARRDAGWNAPVYHFLGMSVGVIAGQNLSFVYDPDFLDETHPDSRLQHLRPCTRREAYACDITYATNNELGFDYLRDNMAMTVEQCVQRRLHYAIVDEVELDPDRRGPHTADHQRPGQRADREVLHLLPADQEPGRRGGLHQRREDQVGDPHRRGRRQDREVDRHLQHLRHRARRGGPPGQPGAPRRGSITSSIGSTSSATARW